jgi:hypothetical protein
MSELKFELHKNNFVMDKGNKKLYFVIKIDLHNVWLRLEDEEKADDADLFKVPKHMINLTYIKVNPDVMKVLYGDKDGIIKPDAIPSNEM